MGRLGTPGILEAMKPGRMRGHGGAEIPDELRGRAVKMLFEVREREGKGRGELAGSRVSWVFT